MLNKTIYLKGKESQIKDLFDHSCTDSVVGTEWSLHQLSPYIGKIKSSIAKFLINHFTEKNDVIYDPFCGASTIPLEALAMGRNVIANDLNKYAYILTLAKLHPPKSIDGVLVKIEKYNKLVLDHKSQIDLRSVPPWVRSFFHKETLRETISWVHILSKKNEWFLLACILGILHHQRPGFLSFPSSHTVPYLRLKKYPPDEYPNLYQYRNVKERLIKKVHRAFKRMPNFDEKLIKDCNQRNASSFIPNMPVDAIISSPPYMRQLDYGRDNRLRLWFLGVDNYKELDLMVSPKETNFIEVMTTCLKNWNTVLKPNGKCILFLGDNYSSKNKLKLPDLIEKIATIDLACYELIFRHESIIPNNRRVRRNYTGNKVETVLVLKKIADGNPNL